MKLIAKWVGRDDPQDPTGTGADKRHGTVLRDGSA